LTSGAVNQVRFKGPHERLVSVEDFLALPLHERIRHILERDIEFLRGDLEVEWREALAWLRTEAPKR